jgi:hypothetical protein
MIWWLAQESRLVSERLQDTVIDVLATCCWGLQRTIELMDANDLIFAEDDAQEASDSLFLFLRGYQWLAAHSASQKLLFFNLRPKCHCVWHTAHEIREWKLNPKMFQTFDEESFLGKIKLVACKCHGRTMTRRVFQRYILLLALFTERLKRTSKA